MDDMLSSDDMAWFDAMQIALRITLQSYASTDEEHADSQEPGHATCAHGNASTIAALALLCK